MTVWDDRVNVHAVLQMEARMPASRQENEAPVWFQSTRDHGWSRGWWWNQRCGCDLALEKETKEEMKYDWTPWKKTGEKRSELQEVLRKMKDWLKKSSSRSSGGLSLFHLSGPEIWQCSTVWASFGYDAMWPKASDFGMTRLAAACEPQLRAPMAYLRGSTTCLPEGCHCSRTPQGMFLLNKDDFCFRKLW